MRRGYEGETEEVRREMAELWAFRALAEASAARRLGRVAEHLERFGDDPALAALARRAVADEERHRGLCLEAASWFGGAQVPPLVPTPVQAPPRATRARALYDIVSACCVSETLNVRIMAASLQVTRDDELRRLQKAILRDEVDHSALGWRHLEAEAARLDVRPLGPLLPGMLGLRSRSRLFEPKPMLADEERLGQLGWLPRRRLLEVYCEAMHEQVFPRLEALGVATDEARAALASSLARAGGG